MNAQDKTRMDKVTVELTFDEALALTGVRLGRIVRLERPPVKKSERLAKRQLIFHLLMG